MNIVLKLDPYPYPAFLIASKIYKKTSKKLKIIIYSSQNKENLMDPAPMPPIRQFLPNPETPWLVSPQLFQKIQATGITDGYKKCSITSNDPEWGFILRYFEWKKPANRCIKAVHCIHSPSASQAFQATISTIDQQAKSPAFSPKWQQEEDAELRQKVNQRWKAMTDPYSPITVPGANSRIDSYAHTKVLPLWHGTKAAICHSICQTGFTFFGKHQLLQEGKKDENNTDTGYFGAGIYFTNSARYAAEVYSDGNLLLAWVSMREPYPVVANAPNLYPDKPKDMRKLEGLGAYQNYNAHHIPIVSVEPDHPNCAIYYPCSQTEQPQCDEIVVFQPSQTLARFWIEVEIELPKSPEVQLTIGAFLQKVLGLLEAQAIQQDIGLTKALEDKAKLLIVLDPNKTIPDQDAEFCCWAMQLLDSAGKVRTFVSKKLLIPQIPLSPTTLQVIPTPIIQPILPKVSQVPAIAFGKAKWAQYFGDIGEEPPLPANIHQILLGPCPFWSGKKVQDTHLLVLIPKTVNGQLLTLANLAQWIQKPKQGNFTKFATWYPGSNENLSVASSYWALMTKDVLEGTLKKSYSDQTKIVSQFAQKAAVPYQPPKLLEAAVCILTEHVSRGARLYSGVYTKCEEKCKNTHWQMVVGSFGARGLVVFDGSVGYDGYGLSCLRRF